MRELLFHLRRDSRTPLQTQLRELLVSAILQGPIPVDGPLPSSRKLAQTLAVAPETVVLADQDLPAYGYLFGRERGEDFVNGEIGGGRAPTASGARVKAAAPDWMRRLKLRPTSQRNVVKLRDWQRY